MYLYPEGKYNKSIFMLNDFYISIQRSSIRNKNNNQNSKMFITFPK